MREAAKGLFWYEALRLCNVNQFSEIHSRNLSGERFDDLVDEFAKKIHYQVNGGG